MDRSSRRHILQQKNDKKIKYNDINIIATAKIKGSYFDRDCAKLPHR